MRPVLAGCATITLVIMMATTAGAQPDLRNTRRPGDAIPFAPYARPTHMWVKWPPGAMYEGDINIPLHLYSRTFDLENPDATEGANPADCLRMGLDRYISLTGTKIVTGCTLTFVPHFVIRQLEGGSAPVQTPTFNPGLEFNWHRLAIDSALGDGARHARLRTIHVRYAHYSNGQSGCLGAFQQLQPDGSCTGEIADGDPLNTIDGSFSTNYLELGLTRSWVTYRNGGERFVHGPALAVRSHVPVPPGQMSPELASVYGRWSVLGGYMIRKRGHVGAYRVVGALIPEGECAPDRAEPYAPCRANVTASMSFPGAYGLGLAAKYTTGFDHYNIGFARERSGFTIGIMFDHTRPMAVSQAARESIARQSR